MTTPNMSRWAQRHGIPRRPPGLASTAANLNATEETERAPALLRHAQPVTAHLGYAVVPAFRLQGRSRSFMGA